WQGANPNPGFAAIEKLLAGRPYTVFAGHRHTFIYEKRNNRDYIDLATAGGDSTLSGEIYGSLDQITWVAMCADGPRISNLPLDSIYGNDLVGEARRHLTAPLLAKGRVLDPDPIRVAGSRFESAEHILTFRNASDLPMRVDGRFAAHPKLAVQPEAIEIVVPPGGVGRQAVKVHAAAGSVALDKLAPLNLAGRLSFLAADTEPLSGDFARVVPVAKTFTTERWDFDADDGAWKASHDCQAAVRDGMLMVNATAINPAIRTDAVGACYATGVLEVRLRARSHTGRGGNIFWTTDQDPVETGDKGVPLRLKADGEWHDYAVPFKVDGYLRTLRVDPGSQPGLIEIDWIEFHPAPPGVKPTATIQY
ncbi:MAG: hypothetical protein M1457_07460, partial [bacterium]|nr:hypothetical protein [bacterium]